MYTLQVEGMGCGSCEMKISQALLKDDPDAKVVVDRAAGKVSVETRSSLDVVSERIRALGFSVSTQD